VPGDAAGDPGGAGHDPDREAWLWARRKEARKDALAEWQEIVNRHERQIDEQQRVIDHLHAGHLDCQVEMTELYGWITIFHDLANRMALALRRAGQDPGEVPPPPPKPRRREATNEGEFLVRTTAANTALIKAADAKMPPAGG
jgi:hypothetical protein